MAKAELDDLTFTLPEMEEEIKLLIIPADPEDDKNAVMEIRAGTGGDEASIFAGDLFRMYTKFFESKGWKVEVTNVSEGTAGGYKEIVMSVTGEGVYGIMKYESGVHRVQRVPQTETQGRIHTSAASVVVLPEADEFDVDLELKISVRTPIVPPVRAVSQSTQHIQQSVLHISLQILLSPARMRNHR